MNCDHKITETVKENDHCKRVRCIHCNQLIDITNWNGKIGVFVLNEIQCFCGSTSFKTLGIQDTVDDMGMPLVLCRKCGTTKSCSQEYYNKLLEKENE